MAGNRAQELEQLIFENRNAYYAGEPCVDDDIYDAWRDELEELDATNVEVLAIGAPVPKNSPWAKVAHGIPMGSLSKLNTPKEMSAWLENLKSKGEVVVSEKLDGFGIHLKYVGGKFTQAITRGGGMVGEDITLNVRRMKDVVISMNGPFTGSIRGEIMLHKSDLKKHLSEYKNARNAVGICRSLEGQNVEHLSVKVYQIVDSNTSFGTKEEQFRFLEAMGFVTPKWRIGDHSIPNAMRADYDLGERDRVDYDIDGLVVELNDLTEQLMLGEVSNRPLGAIAFKFDSVKRETVARKLLKPTGQTGRITPVLIFDPVDLLGTTVTQASVYNWGYIQQLGLGEGARILVCRANDVIPRVEKVTRSGDSVYAPPTHCESCGASVEQDGEYYVCPNQAECPAQVMGRVKQWVKELNILEWGDVLIEKLISSNLVKTVPDLYRLKEENIAPLPRVGNKIAAKVLGTLWERNPIPLDQLLGALSIPLVGADMIRKVMDAGIDTLGKIQGASLDSLKSVKGVGPVKAKSLYEWLRRNESLLIDLFSTGVAVKVPIQGACTGESFCFTGDIPGYPRDDLAAKVISAGGVVKSGVSKSLTYLVMSDPDSNTTKAQAARKNNTKCIGIEEFLSLVQG